MCIVKIWWICFTVAHKRYLSTISYLVFLDHLLCPRHYLWKVYLKRLVISSLRIFMRPVGYGLWNETCCCYINFCKSVMVFWLLTMLYLKVTLHDGLKVKASACNEGDLGSILGSGRSPGEGNGNPLQYSCLENPMDWGAWWDTVHRVAKSQTRLSDVTSLTWWLNLHLIYHIYMLNLS